MSDFVVENFTIEVAFHRIGGSDMGKHYGLYHPETGKFSEELLRYGEIKANSEIQEIDGTNIRIRCIRYKDKVWFHHMENGVILEIFEL